VMSTKAALAYWTPARLRAAKPVSIIHVAPKAVKRTATARPSGEPGSIRGGLPAGAAADAAAEVPRRAGSVTPLAFSYPYPFDLFDVPNSYATKYPWAVNGALFFINDGVDYSCSATSVASRSGTSLEDEIWTAGHCAANTNGTHQWDSAAVFIPAYDGNVSNFDPFGEFYWTGGAQTTGAWFYNSDLSEDEAAMIVGNSTTTGRTLGQAVGWDGFAWNQSVNQQFTAFTYGGGTMWQDSAATTAQNCLAGQANPVCPIAIGGPVPGGGGAWDIDWTLTSPGYINGHNDFSVAAQPDAVDSPYQDTLSNELRCFGVRSC
jgi:hypothetical protein